MKQDSELLMLWQQEKTPIETVLMDAMSHMKKKYNRVPAKIYVSDKLDLKEIRKNKLFEGITFVHDNQMYALGLVSLVM